MRILVVLEETGRWRSARQRGYTYQFADALRALGHQVTVTNPYFGRHAPYLYRGRKFDMLWVNLMISTALDDGWGEWATSVALVRLGLLLESLEYTYEELGGHPQMALFRGYLERRLRYLTHVLLGDEADEPGLRERGLAAMWLPYFAPEQELARVGRVVPGDVFGFAGTPYEARTNYLADPGLRAVMQTIPSSESGTWIPHQFDALHLIARPLSKYAWPGLPLVSRLYHLANRGLRRRAFQRWLRGLASLGAVVNLPHLNKSYVGRIYEAMGVGRPVVAWSVPNRPRNLALFEDGREIFLYRTPEELADLIGRLRRDRGRCEAVAEAGRQKVLERHTTEVRFREILDWIESGREPVY